VLEAASVSYGKASTYFPVVELLRSYFQIEARDDGRKLREKVTGKLLSLDRALEPALPVFLSLLGVAVDDAGWATLDPPRRRRRTLEALKRLLVRESQVQPLLLVVEDLHWIDGETQAFLDTLVDSVPTARILLLVNYRPEYSHGWGSKTYYQQLRLVTLPTANAEELLEALLGPDPGLADLRRLLIDRTQGNPFFLEETVHALVEAGTLTGDRGAYRPPGPMQNVQLPATVQAILAARIDRLLAEDKRLLQAAAVIGKEVPLALLQAIVDEPEETLRRGLMRLQGSEFLYETRLFPDIEYTFKHALTHEVAYGGVLQDRRRVLHARALESLERIAGDRTDEHLERLAHHAVRAEAWDRAVEFLRQAADRAAARSANREAIAHLRAALACLDHEPETRHRTEQAIDLRIDITSAASPLREFDTIAPLLAEAESLAGTLGDSRRMARVAYRVSMLGFLTGDLDRLMTSSEQAVRLASEANDVTVLALGRDNLGRAYYLRGMYQRARKVLEQNITTLTGDLQRQRFGQAGFLAVYSRQFLARTCATIGAFAEAQAYAEQANSIAGDHPHSSIAAANAAAHVALVRGEFGVAATVLDRALALSESLDIRVWLPVLASNLGHAYVELRRIDEAMPLLQRGAALVGEDEPMRLVQLAVGYLRAGRVQDASSTVKRALAIAIDRGQRGAAADARRTLGEIMATGGDSVDAASAEAEYKTALDHGESLGMRPLVAHCHLGLGKLYRRTDSPDQAREHLATATTMYCEMEMRFWLEQAEAEIRALA
jgi:tetratricopeptide (TPR) repeat protein